MATITIDASSQANINTVHTPEGGAYTPMQKAIITFTPSGTYDQDASESIEITNVDQAIEQSRRNGRTVTLVDAVGWKGARVAATPATLHMPTAVSVQNTNDVYCTIFTLTEASGVGSEYTDDTALPTYQEPMQVLVTFTEA